MFSIPWLSVLQDRFQSCVRKNNRRRQLQKHSSHTPHIARAVSMHAAESLEERMLLTAFTVVNTNDSGEGSLRAAIEAANAEAGADEITFADTLAGQTIILTAELLITDAVTITGLGANQLTIDANSNSRIFHIDDGDWQTDLYVAISGLTLRNGAADRGGAILTYEDLRISHSNLSNNIATEFGGAIAAWSSTLSVDNSLIADNSASLNGGGIHVSDGVTSITQSALLRNQAFNDGGGIASHQAMLTLQETRMGDNSAGRRGGGVYLVQALNGLFIDDSGQVHPAPSPLIENTIFIHNRATKGGGIYNAFFMHEFGSRDLLISNSRFVNNTAVYAGGGLYNGAPRVLISDSEFSQNQAVDGAGINNSGGFISITNSTLTGNHATSSGGAIRTLRSMSIINCTLSGNHADGHGGGIYQTNGANITPLPRLRNLEDTSRIVPENGLSPFDSSVEPLRADAQFMRNGLTVQYVSDVRFAYIIFGSLKVTNSTITGNVAGISGGGIFTYSATTITNSIVAGNTAEISAQIQGNYSGKTSIIQDSIDGLLDPVLRDNGGPTWTHALLPGSAALNAGENAAATDAGLTTDQRGAGYERIKDGSVDIGAYEAQSPFTQIEMRFTNSRTRASSTGEKSRLPENRTWIDQWGNHWLEIWVSTPDSTTTGIQSAEFNLNFNPEVAQAVSIEYGPAFTGNQTETIDNSAGKITGLSATTARPDVGDDQYVLLARIQFEASPATQNADDYSDSREHIVNPQFSLSQLHVQLVGGMQSEVIDATTLGTLYDRSGQDDSDAQFFTVPQYDFSQTGLYNLDWGHATRGGEFNSALDLSQLSLIVLPYTQSFLADENSDLLTQNQVDGSQTTGNASAGDRKTDISAPDGEHSLLDDYFSELNDTLELLAFES